MTKKRRQAVGHEPEKPPEKTDLKKTLVSLAMLGGMISYVSVDPPADKEEKADD